MKETKALILKAIQRERARQFLKATKARAVSVTASDTWKRTVYEIDLLENGTDLKTEVWIERESKLEEPEYFYNLWQFTLAPDASAGEGDQP